MLKPDAQLPALGAMWLPESTLAFFNDENLGEVRGGEAANAAHRVYSSYKAGRECVLLDRLTFRRSSERTVKVTFAGERRLQRMCERHAMQRERDPSLRATLLPEKQCFVELYPADWKLPGLAVAVDPDRMSRELLPYMNGQRTAPSSHIAVAVLRHRPRKRAVIYYRVALSDGNAAEFVSKVYPRTAEAEDVQSKSSALLRYESEHTGFPRPLGVIYPWRLLLMEHAPGQNAADILRAANPSEAHALLDAIVVALVELHAARIPRKERRTVSDEMSKLNKRIRRFSPVAPWFAERAASLFERLMPLVSGLSSASDVVIHGDFTPGQLLFDGQRVTVTDLDRVCFGDPAIDLGNFCAKMGQKAVLTGQDHFRQFATYFLGQYEERTGAGLTERARLYQAVALTRKAAGNFEGFPATYAKPSGGKGHLLLKEALACLARL